MAGVGALLVGVVLVAIVLFGGDSGHKYKLLFETGGQLVAGNQVLVGGQPIGTVDDISLTDDAQAAVDDHRRRAAARGTTAIDPRDLALGDRQPLRLDLAGPQQRAGAPGRRTIPRTKTTSPVDLDQLFDTFDAKTRRGLGHVIQGQATVYTGNGKAANADLQVPRARAAVDPACSPS